MIPSEKYAQIDQLAEDFAARIRRGERPTYKDYIARHPELADEIRELCGNCWPTSLRST